MSMWISNSSTSPTYGGGCDLCSFVWVPLCGHLNGLHSNESISRTCALSLWNFHWRCLKSEFEAICQEERTKHMPYHAMPSQSYSQISNNYNFVSIRLPRLFLSFINNCFSLMNSFTSLLFDEQNDFISFCWSCCFHYIPQTIVWLARLAHCCLPQNKSNHSAAFADGKTSSSASNRRCCSRRRRRCRHLQDVFYSVERVWARELMYC